MKIQVNKAATPLYQASLEAEGKKEFDKAVELCLRAIELDPKSALLRNKLINGLCNARQFQRAILLGEEAVRVSKERLDEYPEPANPDDFDYDRNVVFRLWHQTRMRVGTARLALGDYEQGWRDFESRFEIFDLAGQNMIRSPEDVANFRDGTIVLRFDAGIGDSIHFSRYFPLWKDRCSRIILQTHPELIRIFQLTFPFAEVIPIHQDIPPKAGIVQVMSQPYLLGLGAPDPSQHFPYLDCGDPPIARTGKPIRIGLKPKGSQRDLREFDIALFEPLLELPRKMAQDGGRQIELHLLEKAILKPEEQSFLSRFPIHQHQSEFTDLLTTAKFVNGLDLVIAVDTAVAHLAGALAAPTWVMIPFVQDSRWGVDPDRTGWYPTMRLFRENLPGRWSNVIERIVEALE